MNPIAERLKSARIMAGLSLQDLADKLDNCVTRQALHKYEKGEFMPDAQMLELLRDALGVTQDFFQRINEIEMGEISFRKHQNFTVKEKKGLEERSKNILERYLELERILNIPTDFLHTFKDRSVNTNQDIEQVAIALRKAWKLGNGPIFNLIELLEDNKIKVIEIESADGFDGLSAWANEDTVPLIVLNNSIIKSLDRKRFTALHELAHLILNFDKHSERQREKFCNHFAGAMLLPEETLRKEVGNSRTKLLLPELGAIKKQYGISIQAIAYRMKELGIISPTYFKQFMFFIEQSGFKFEEPFAYQGQEESRRFNQLLFRALGEELISMDKAASLNNQKLADFKAAQFIMQN